ncbi:MAG: TIM-barrel domain-containing protein [Planctomycetota bacterium]
MYFNKSHQPENFRFVDPDASTRSSWKIDGKAFRRTWSDLGRGVYRLDVSEKRWPAQHSQAELSNQPQGESLGLGSLDASDGVRLADTADKEILASHPGRVFGVSGQAWLMQFDYDPQMRFYGQGEKTTGLEHTGKHTKFWNTDVWADFDMGQVIHGAPDPMYLSVPYLIVKRGNRYAGVLINNPHAVFMATNPKVTIAHQADAEDDAHATRLFVGAPDGVPEVYFLVGPSLAELTRKLQNLVGRTPLPPMWALGHHQCRWGYASYRDLDRLDKEFTRHRIPNDGLWLDIDYMRGYRVFTWNDKHWPKLARQIASIQARGRKVVPILDPGVKIDPRFNVYKSGVKADVFCQNPAGSEFVGFVWPGATAFPDFSLDAARKWWGRWVGREVVSHDVQGAWLDMNDPSTGPAENSEMRFDRGQQDHATYHNQYALGMAKATRDGFLKRQPNRRPFLLTRSGYTSINRYAAAWTGDNYSNPHHLRNAIATSINLALSGVPFNGPDVPGFGGDATPELAVAWYKAGFLFPFLRNHSISGCREQEPWALGPSTTRVVRRYIRLRYKLLPYLYNLFAQQEETGEAILRPLFYDFADSRKLPLDRVDDQFMVGPAIMQAPVLDPDAATRQALLPAGQWFDAQKGKWIDGGLRIDVRASEDQTPLFVRDGAVLPTRPGDPSDNATDLRDIELHLFLSPGFRGKAAYTYHADDGQSFDYRKGARTTLAFEVRRKDTGIDVAVQTLASAYGPVKVRFVLYAPSRRLTVTHDTATPAGNPARRERTPALKPYRWSFTGKPLSARRSTPVTLGG